MVRINVKEIEEKARESFERAWLETAELLKGKGVLGSERDICKGRSHVVMDVVERFRQVFLELGFIEVINPLVVEEIDVYKQYGLEAPAILDRCYYLASLPRPDVGLSTDKIEQMKALGVALDDERVRRLQTVLHDYKKGRVSGDDLVEKVAEALLVEDTLSMKILDEVFPEFKELKPQASNLILRSHMTSAWFQTLSVLQHKLRHPIKLFSVGIRVRREQQEDSTHLRVHFGASSVILDEEVSVEDGKLLATKILSSFGFSELKFKQKEVTAKYYAPKTEYEVFGYNEKLGWVELANFGLYSPVALARYGIEYPVLNLGIGVERVVAALYGFSDIREVEYPQFYGEWKLSDGELASMIYVDKKPFERLGFKIADSIVKCIEDNKDAPSPCEIVAFDGEAYGKKVRVMVYEHDPGVKLVGPAAFNVVYVVDGNVVGIPPKGMDDVEIVRMARERGISTGIRYLDAIASLCAYEIIKALKQGDKEVNVRIRIAKQLSDVNLGIEDVALNYISSKRKRIDIRGPVFIGVKAAIQDE
ncbi:MAG: O-phosphoserine--tRNA ligase [Candidatus Methanomethylicota archaeon]|nr:MAG: O-phosphoserine--tRNA ligase [Candidatus Verstraetearchaeota archaeon]